MKQDRKFNLGDKVMYRGEEVQVIGIDNSDTCIPYAVEVDGFGSRHHTSIFRNDPDVEWLPRLHYSTFQDWAAEDELSPVPLKFSLGDRVNYNGKATTVIGVDTSSSLDLHYLVEVDSPCMSRLSYWKSAIHGAEYASNAWHDPRASWVTEGDLKALPKPAIKVGDRVKVITKKHGARQLGNVGVVTETNRDAHLPWRLPVKVDFAGCSGAPDRFNTYRPEDLEVLPNTHLGFTIGQKVRVKDGRYKWAAAGDVGVVAVDQPFEDQVNIDFSGNPDALFYSVTNKTCSYPKEDVEVYTKPTKSPRFSAGQKVTCVDGWGSRFNTGEQYTIERAYMSGIDEYVRIDGSGGWSASRFEPYVESKPALTVTPKFRVGQKVKCVDDGGKPGLMKGDVYVVESTFKGSFSSSIFVKVEGLRYHCFESRFEPYEETPQELAAELFEALKDTGATITITRSS